MHFKPVVWWAASVEVHSAIARLQRFGKLDAPARTVALKQLAVLECEWQEIVPSDEVRERAKALLHRYPLRAADGLQLGAALIWSGNRPAGRSFLCADERLAAAAEQAGFTVLRP
jgi:predicted nucleic acid-binding protein